MKIVASGRPQLDTIELTVDWIHLSPYAASGQFESRILDGGRVVNWTSLTATTTLAGGAVSFDTRTGNRRRPDGTWSSFQTVTGGVIDSPDGRYLQYRATLARAADSYLTPRIDNVSTCGAACISTGAPESICNGVDDDCDGSGDEDYVGTPTSCGVGACASTGVTTCTGGPSG